MSEVCIQVGLCGHGPDSEFVKSGLLFKNLIQVPYCGYIVNDMVLEVWEFKLDSLTATQKWGKIYEGSRMIIGTIPFEASRHTQILLLRGLKQRSRTDLEAPQVRSSHIFD